MKPQGKELYKKVRACYQETLVALEQLQADVLTEVDSQEVVDLIYVLRESAAYADKTRKEVEKVRKLAARIGVIHCDTMAVEKITTDYCSGKPKSIPTFNFPAKRRYDPEKFDKIMESFGIPQEIASQEPVRINWPGFQAYCQLLLAEGKNPPAGVDIADGQEEYDFAIVKRRGKEIDESSTVVESKEGEYTAKFDDDVPF